jgi:hypothetical protein
MHSQTLRKIDFKANDIVYSLAQNSLYASAQSANKTFGNSVCRLDPVTGAVTKSVFVGTEPTCLAVSDDGKYLYVGLERIPRIMRLKLPEMQPDLTIQLMDTSNIYRGSVFAEQIKVLPNKPTSIAVIVGHYVTPSFLYIAIFDNAIERPSRGYDRSYLSQVTNMAFLGKSDTLIGGYPGYDSYVIPITAQGIPANQSFYRFRTSFYDKQIKYSVRDSLVYTGYYVLNPRSNPAFNIIHSFGFTDVNSDIIVEPDPLANATFISYTAGGKLLLKRFSTNTRLLTNEWTLTSLADEKARQIISLGKAEKMATLTNNFIFLVDNGCVSSVVNTPTIVQGFAATVCSDSSITLSVNSSNKVLWSTGDTSATIKVSTAGKYSVAFVDAQGCAGPSSAATTVTQVTSPERPYITTVDPNAPYNPVLTLCQGEKISMRAITFDGSPIKWNTGQTTPILNLSQAGSYYVVATNSAGCQARSNTVTINTRPQQAPPKPIIDIIGKTDLCTVDEYALLQAPFGYNNYKWSNFATTQSITASPSFIDSFAVKVTNTEGCSSELSDYVKVRRLQTPPKPILQYQDSILKSTNTAFYQHRWFRNGELIAPNTVSFKPISAGFYTVQAYTGQCNSPFSDWANILLPIKSSVASIAQDGFIQVFPNPTENEMRIQIISDFKGGTVELYDVVGQLLKTEKILATDNQLDISLASLLRGSYMLVWKSKDGMTRGVKKIIKL